MSSTAKKYFIKTFGCAANVADSERIASYLNEQGMKKTDNLKKADCIVINTCMVRESAENRVYGLVNNISKIKNQKSKIKTTTKKLRPKVILTGCMVGITVRDKTGKLLKTLKKRMPQVDEFLPIEEIGLNNKPIRSDKKRALVPISNGCNNFCTFCVVPYTRGREISRPLQEIINECRELKNKGYQEVILLGQNVNSYGADIVKIKDQKSNLPDGKAGIKNKVKNSKVKIGNKYINPILVKHLGRYRIPTLFPYLLEEVAKMGFQKVDFMSSNPWDFSDELISVIARNKNITRTVHLPIQSGDDQILKKMNRWYTRDEYLKLVANLKSQISNLKISTDIIVGFCGETKKQFQNTVGLCKKAGFEKAYLAIYSDRPMTAAYRSFKDNVPYVEKKRRWQILENLINKPNLKKHLVQ